MTDAEWSDVLARSQVATYYRSMASAAPAPSAEATDAADEAAALDPSTLWPD